MILQQLLWAYLRNILSRLDDSLRMSVKETLERASASLERTSFLSKLVPGDIAITTQTAKQQKSEQVRLIIAPHVWQQRLRVLVGEIIVPDLLAWMDDDEGLSVPQLAQRALFEIQNRFEGYAVLFQSSFCTI